MTDSITKERTFTTGTGTYTLDGVAMTGFRTFAAAIEAGHMGATVSCLVTNGVQRELVRGIYDNVTRTLTRVTILASTNDGAPINWGPGPKEITSVDENLLAIAGFEIDSIGLNLLLLGGVLSSTGDAQLRVDLDDPTMGSLMIAHLPLGGVARSLRDKVREIVSIGDHGGRRTNTPAANRIALQDAISVVDATDPISGSVGFVAVSGRIDYGYNLRDDATAPDLSGCVNDIIVCDMSEADADPAGNRCGAQLRYFSHTPSASAGFTEGNGFIWSGTYHPWMCIDNRMPLAAPGHASRTAFDNRRARNWYTTFGIAKWSAGQGTTAGPNETENQLHNYSVEAYNSPINETGLGLHDGSFAAIVVDFDTAQISLCGGTNTPAATVHVSSAISGQTQGMFENSFGVTSAIEFRNSAGSGDDVALRNTSGDFIVFITSQGDALRVNKADRRVGIGISASYKLDVHDNRSDYVANIENDSATNGSGLWIVSASAAGTAWDVLRGMSSGSDSEFLLRGDGNGLCDGAWTGGGADYAEYFEWADGNPDGEDRRGLAVTLSGDKIKTAIEGDSLIGVISGNPSVVGDAAWNKWNEKYLRDDFGAYVMEEYEIVEWEEQKLLEPERPEVARIERAIPVASLVLAASGKPAKVTYKMKCDEPGRPAVPARYETIKHSYAADEVPEGIAVPKDAKRTTQQRRILNPKWDPDADYIPRPERDEWGVVGLMGKLRLRKGQPVGDRWIKMRDVSASVEEWLVR